MCQSWPYCMFEMARLTTKWQYTQVHKSRSNTWVSTSYNSLCVIFRGEKQNSQMLEGTTGIHKLPRSGMTVLNIASKNVGLMVVNMCSCFVTKCFTVPHLHHEDLQPRPRHSNIAARRQISPRKKGLAKCRTPHNRKANRGALAWHHLPRL